MIIGIIWIDSLFNIVENMATIGYGILVICVVWAIQLKYKCMLQNIDNVYQGLTDGIIRS